MGGEKYMFGSYLGFGLFVGLGIFGLLIFIAWLVCCILLGGRIQNESRRLGIEHATWWGVLVAFPLFFGGFFAVIGAAVFIIWAYTQKPDWDRMFPEIARLKRK